MDENVTSPVEGSIEQPASSSIETKEIADSKTQDGQEETKKEDDIEIPALPDDLPEEQKIAFNLELQKAKRQMQSQFTKKTQELATMRKQYDKEMGDYKELLQYKPLLEQLSKGETQQKQEIDFESMSDDERLQYIIDQQTESKLQPYKQQLEALAKEKEMQQAEVLEKEARDYASGFGLDFDQYVPDMIDLDNRTGNKLSFKDLLKIVASDDLQNLITEKAKSELIASLRKKKESTPPESKGGNVVPRKMSIEEAYKSALQEI